jgi:hypothetical protein
LICHENTSLSVKHRAEKHKALKRPQRGTPFEQLMAARASFAPLRKRIDSAASMST